MAAKIYLFLAALALTMLAGLAQRAEAAINNAYSIVYFDADDNVIGQEVVYCNNVAKWQGVVDRRNPNYVREEFGCGQPLVTCGESQTIPTSNGPVTTADCKPAGVNHGSYVVSFHSALGHTVTDYCNHGATPYFTGAPTCGLPAPSLVYGMGAIYDGFPPSN